MKRNHEELCCFVPELPKDVWIRIFRVIGDQRLLRIKAVSREWDEWIISDGLVKLTKGSEGFMKKMKNIRDYKSISSAKISSKDFSQLLLIKRGKDVFPAVKYAFFIIEEESEKFYFKGMRHMTNLVSLRILSPYQDIHSSVLSKLPLLSDLVIVLYGKRNYKWLSEMKQIKTLTLSHTKIGKKISPNEMAVVENSIVQLTQLETLSLTEFVSSIGFLEKMTFLKRFILDADPGVSYDYTPISHLVNLRQLVLLSEPGLTGMELFENMSNLECLIFPGIPTNYPLLQEKFPKLGHLKLEMTFSFMEKNMKLLTNFMQNPTQNKKVKTGLRVRIGSEKLSPVVCANYVHLFSFVSPEKSSICYCSLCDGYKLDYIFYLPPEAREIF